MSGKITSDLKHKFMFTLTIWDWFFHKKEIPLRLHHCFEKPQYFRTNVSSTSKRRQRWRQFREFYDQRIYPRV